MRKLLLILLSVFVVFLIWGVVAGIDIQRGMLNESFIEQVLEDIPLAEAASRELPRIIMSELPAEMPPVIRQELPHAIASVFTPEWFQKTLKQVSSEMLAALRRGENLDAAISIEAEKQLVYEQLLYRLGELSDEELMRGGMPRFMIAFIPYNQLMQGIPNTLSLQQILTQSDVQMNVGEMLDFHQRARRNFIIGIALLIPMCAAGFVLLAGLNGALRWAGWTFIVSGSLYLSGLLLLHVAMPGIIASAGDIPETAREILLPASEMMLRLFMFSPMLVVGIGALLVILSLILPRRRSSA